MYYNDITLNTTYMEYPKLARLDSQLFKIKFKLLKVDEFYEDQSLDLQKDFK